MSAGLTAGHTKRFKNSSMNVNASYFNLKPSNAVVPQNLDWLEDPNSISLGGNYRVKTSETGILKIFNSTTQNKMKLRSVDVKTLKKNKSIIFCNI